MALGTPVDIETGKKLKEKKFSELVKSYYDEKRFGKKLVEFYGKIDANNMTYLSLTKGTIQSGYISAPTIGEVLDWFYEVHGIHLTATPTGILMNDWNYHISISGTSDEIKLGRKLNYKSLNGNFKSRKETYIAGINFVLNKLL